jgi:hypothetical protein
MIGPMQSNFELRMNADLVELRVLQSVLFCVQRGPRYDAPYFLPSSTTKIPDSSIGTAAA